MRDALAPQNEPQKPTSRDNNSQPSSDLADIIFMAMPQIWPRFTDDYGVTPTPAWIHATDGLSYEQVDKTLRRCARSTNPRPPTPGQFRAIALDGHVRDTSQDTPPPADFKTRVRRHCHWMLTNLLIPGENVIPPTMRRHEVEAISFPFDSVVSRVDLKKINKQHDLDTTKGMNIAFKQLRERFDLEWSVYERTGMSEEDERRINTDA